MHPWRRFAVAMRLGLLGGTFDPIHLGHLIIAEEARRQFSLEQVLFMPAGQPWLKEGQPVTPARHRLEMVRRAIAGNPHFAIATHEIERPGSTYTVETLQELHRELGPAADLYFILGLDALERFHLWKEPERILELCYLVVVNRPGCDSMDWPQFFARYPQAAGRVTLLSAPPIGISATDIRQRAARGVSYRYQVPASVAEYIEEEGLYRNDMTKDEGRKTDVVP